jgi:F420-0:gamma-glutamyl ligase
MAYNKSRSSLINIAEKALIREELIKQTFFNRVKGQVNLSLITTVEGQNKSKAILILTSTSNGPVVSVARLSQDFTWSVKELNTILIDSATKHFTKGVTNYTLAIKELAAITGGELSKEIY